jgi:hypothetical protein
MTEERNAGASQARELPKLDFTTFILSVSSAAFMGLGVRPDSSTEESSAPVDLEMSRQNIDLLELLAEKTRGNRTAEEDRLLTQLLFETRLRYVETQKRLASSVRKGG